MGVLLEEFGQFGVDGILHQSTDLGVTQLGLGLALELGVLQLHRHDGAQTLADVLARELIVPLEDPRLAAVLVDGAGQTRAEAGLVHTALDGVHVVGEGLDDLLVAVVVLHGDLGNAGTLLALHVNDLIVDGVGVLVLDEEADEGADTALKAEVILPEAAVLVGLTLVAENDAHARVEEGLLPQTAKQGLVLKDRLLKDGRVGLEGHLHAVGPVGRGTLALEGAGHVASFKPLGVVLTVHRVVQLQPFRQSVDHRGTHAVEAARDLVAAAAELTARVEDGIDHLGGGDALLGVDTAGDTAAVINDGDAVALVDDDLDLVAVPRQGLVDGVIHDLIDQMVESADGGGTDVHTRALAHRLQAFQHLYLFFVVYDLFFYLILLNVSHVSDSFSW